MQRHLLSLLILVSVACAGAQPRPGSPPRQTPPTRIILLIADGAGLGHWTAGVLLSDSLAVARFPVVALVDTRNAAGRLTDSAAGATAFAIGERSFNGAIGVTADSAPRRTLLEHAEAAGLATGLVTTTAITDATPAAFGAHVVSRRMQPEIASQLAGAGIEVLIGDGRGYFSGTRRRDGRDLRPLLERHAWVESLAAFRALPANQPVVALFGETGLPFRDPAKPLPAEAAAHALQVLDLDPDGFFLMIESEATDETAHENLSLDTLGLALLDFDDAVRVAVRYQERHPETLIVVTADHETGGLALQQDPTGAPVAAYTTRGHSLGLVPLFAKGPGAERFHGIIRNDEVGRILRDLVLRAAPGTDR